MYLKSPDRLIASVVSRFLPGLRWRFSRWSRSRRRMQRRELPSTDVPVIDESPEKRQEAIEKGIAGLAFEQIKENIDRPIDAIRRSWSLDTEAVPKTYEGYLAASTAYFQYLTSSFLGVPDLPMPPEMAAGLVHQALDNQGGFGHAFTVALSMPDKGLPYLLDKITLYKRREHTEQYVSLCFSGFDHTTPTDTNLALAEQYLRAYGHLLPEEWCIKRPSQLFGLTAVAKCHIRLVEKLRAEETESKESTQVDNA